MISRSVTTWFASLVLGILTLSAENCTAVDATFVLDEQQSSLTIDASTVFVIPVNDSATQPLTGTIETTLDFGTTGTLPATADITVNSAAISPLNPFSLTLGLPPLLGVNVDITGVVADLSTPNPPATLTMLPTGLVRYQFDAAEFDVTLNQGIASVTGVVNETADLAATPVTGTAAENTFGQITFLDIVTNGPYTQIDALLTLPIAFTEVFDADGREVTLDVNGDIVATSSFSVALSGVSDFDLDNDIDGRDYLLLQQNDPVRISEWTTGYPGAAGSLVSALAVPEPSTGVVLIFALISAPCLVEGHRRCRRR